MQNIRFITNLDKYQYVRWPEVSFVPRKGEEVFASKKSQTSLISEKLPIKLEVTAVRYEDNYVTVELWYRNIDVESYSMSYGKEHLFQ